jgi:hypothetical protein
MFSTLSSITIKEAEDNLQLTIGLGSKTVTQSSAVFHVLSQCLNLQGTLTTSRATTLLLRD